MTNANGINVNFTGSTGSGAIVLNTNPSLDSPIFITPSLGNAIATSLNINGTAGSGFIELASQTSIPSTGATRSVRLLSGDVGVFGFIPEVNPWGRFFSGNLTTHRVYTFQDSSDTFVMRDTTDTLTNKTFDTAAAGNVLMVNGTQITDVIGPDIPTGTIGLTSSLSFTPTLAFDGDDTGITYSSQVGELTQNSNVVNFKIGIVLTSKGAVTGRAAIYGIPIGNAANIIFYTNIIANNLTFLGNNQVCGYTSDTDLTNKIINLIYPQTGASYGFYTDAQFTDTTEIYMSGMFFTS